MRILFIGGTGIISSACTQLAAERGHDVFVLNRGASAKASLPDSVTGLVADIRDPSAVRAALGDLHFDAVADFIAFTPADIERDIALFAGRTRQFVFVSSASCYQKPPTDYRITEDCPLDNPVWEYSQQKIAAELKLMEAYRADRFPATIVRPSLTYGPTSIPLAPGSWAHPWTIPARMLAGKPVLLPGDGSSLWTVTWNEDFAKGLVGLLGRETTIGHAFHITSDEVLSWRQIFLEVAHALGVEPNFLPVASETLCRFLPEHHGSLLGDKAHSCVLDNTKIKRFVPDFVATVPWSDGVRRALDWFRADAARQTIDIDADARMDSFITRYQAMLGE